MNAFDLFGIAVLVALLVALARDRGADAREIPSEKITPRRW